MVIYHKDYVKYEIPNDWSVEEENNTTSIYYNYGEGALTISYYTSIKNKDELEEQIANMAKDFIDRNSVRLRNSLVLGCLNNNMYIYSEGHTNDNWYIKIWVIASYPNILLISYQSENKTKEIKTIEKIVDSFCFLN